ncbi:PilN domain-containing protein [Permianibacter sp. IMCC34836]|uniref:PilN domain-containing protein n=1 Tax=Permianibacter fluminis TaxID=2738515 RepID=UPI0015544CEA|nr:PilN domain-containing protein [Permianibacter fluminis]NQD36292.1 PilN domain-containing protein [Permianibacter fluminis]
MAKINLLPWRAEERRERARQFYSMLVLSMILTALLMGVVHLTYAGMISDQELRNTYLESEIKVVDKEIEEINLLEKQRADLEQRMGIIQELQQSRPLNVHLFDELPRLLPEGIFLTELVRKDNKLTVKGKTESSPRVAAFMRNIESSQWIGNPDLDNIAADKKSATPSSDFLMYAIQKGVKPPEPKEDPKAKGKKDAKDKKDSKKKDAKKDNKKGGSK